MKALSKKMLSELTGRTPTTTEWRDQMTNRMRTVEKSVSQMTNSIQSVDERIQSVDEQLARVLQAVEGVTFVGTDRTELRLRQRPRRQMAEEAAWV